MVSSPLIAVIDDEDAFLDLMDAILHDEGYRVVVGKVPDYALTLIRERHPALVILDLSFRMSEMQGMEILRAMRDDESLAGTPVIVCSAAHDLLKQRRDEFDVLGARTLDKPFVLTNLLALVAEMLPP